MRQLEPGDTILSCHNCARIQGLDVVDSLLLMCKVHAWLINARRLGVRDAEDTVLRLPCSGISTSSMAIAWW